MVSDNVVMVQRLKPDVLEPTPGISFVGDPGKTKQSSKDECDINKIVSKARKSGGMNLLQYDARSVYADVSKVGTFVDMQNLIVNANQDFMKLSAKTRKLFDNKVLNMVEYVSNIQDTEESLKEAFELGLVPKEAYEAKVKIRVDAENAARKAAVTPAQ